MRVLQTQLRYQYPHTKRCAGIIQKKLTLWTYKHARRNMILHPPKRYSCQRQRCSLGFSPITHPHSSPQGHIRAQLKAVTSVVTTFTMPVLPLTSGRAYALIAAATRGPKVEFRIFTMSSACILG